MLEGTRPKECEYCWKIEDMEKDEQHKKDITVTEQGMFIEGKIPPKNFCLFSIARMNYPPQNIILYQITFDLV